MTRAPAIGGAKDLAVGAKRIWVVMEHTTKTGEKRILRRCTYPLTATACVKRVYTDLAVIDVTDKGLVVIDTVPGVTVADLQALGDAELHASRVFSSSSAKAGPTFRRPERGWMGPGFRREAET